MKKIFYGCGLAFIAGISLMLFGDEGGVLALIGCLLLPLSFLVTLGAAAIAYLVTGRKLEQPAQLKPASVSVATVPTPNILPPAMPNAGGPIPETFVFVGGVRTGPLQDENIRDSIKNGAFDDEAMAWRAGMEGWVPLEELYPEFRKQTTVEPPPVPVASENSDGNSGGGSWWLWFAVFLAITFFGGKVLSGFMFPALHDRSHDLALEDVQCEWGARTDMKEWLPFVQFTLRNTSGKDASVLIRATFIEDNKVRGTPSEKFITIPAQLSNGPIQLVGNVGPALITGGGNWESRPSSYQIAAPPSAQNGGKVWRYQLSIDGTVINEGDVPPLSPEKQSALEKIH